MSVWSRAPSLVNRMCSVHCLVWVERRVVLVTMMWSHPLELWTSCVKMLVVGASHKDTTMMWIQSLQSWTSCENACCWCESQGEMYSHDVNSVATVVNIVWKCWLLVRVIRRGVQLWREFIHYSCEHRVKMLVVGASHKERCTTMMWIHPLQWKCSLWVWVKSVSEQCIDLKSYHFRCEYIVKVFVVLLYVIKGDGGCTTLIVSHITSVENRSWKCLLLVWLKIVFVHTYMHSDVI